MTLILKSDMAVVPPKTTGLTAEAILRLDFRYMSFINNGVKVDSLDGIIKTTSSAGSGYYSPFGDYNQASANENVISTDLSSLNRGLFIEASSTNIFTNSLAPVSKTVSLVSDRVSAHIISMIGKGSLQVSINDAPAVTVTENKPYSLPSTETTITSSASITVLGDVKYVGVDKVVATKERVTRLGTTGAIRSYVPSILQIEPTLLSSLLTNFAGCVVIRQYIPDDVVATPPFNRQTIAILSLLDSTDKGIFAAKGISAPYEFAVRTNSGVEKTIESITPQAQFITTALNFNKTSTKMAVNGSMVGGQDFDSVNLSRMFLGSSPTWSTASTSYIIEVLLFNRQLTNDELIEITAV